MNGYIYRIFDSVSAVLVAARKVERSGIECKIVPIPRRISSECGVCLRSSTTSETEVERVLAGGNLREKRVHRL